MSSIFIYNGKGSGEDSRFFFHESLLDSVDSEVHNIHYISAEEIIEGNWTKTCKLLCFGGGYDLGFIESLGSPGVRMIREYVLNGGNYLGMCAGAYFATDYIEFDKNGPLEVVGSRDLKFYPGKCIGPAFPGFAYASKRGVHAVPVSYRNSLTLDSYFHGGGYFLPPDAYDHSNSQNVVVLGNYESLEQSHAAIVKCRIGKGCAILSGVHLEFQVKQLDSSNIHLKKCMASFMDSEERRNFVFRDILSQLGLRLQSQKDEFTPQSAL